MRCEVIQRQLSDYLDNSLATSVSNEIECHLSSCRMCSQKLESMRRTVRLVRVVEEAEFVPPARLENLQSRVLKTLEQDRSRSWLERVSAMIRMESRAIRYLWYDVMQTAHWQHWLQVSMLTVLLVFAGIWVDRHYFRTNLPNLIHKALVAENSYTPSSVIGTNYIANPRVPRLLERERFLERETEALRHSETLDQLTLRLVAPLPVAQSEGMEVRAVDLKDGRLLFVGVRDIAGVSPVDTDESPLRDISMPTDNPTVVMLPMNFDGPVAPARDEGRYFLAKFLDQWTYPVASPTRVPIEDRKSELLLSRQDGD